MSRPSELQVGLALDVLNATADEFVPQPSFVEQRRALAVVRRALAPRPVWPAKEVGEHLGVNPANLRVGRMQNFDKFPEPAQELPRPTEKDPGKTVRFWFVDEVEDFKRDYMRGGQ